MSQQSNAIRKPRTKKTFYRRQLPSPPAIAFASKEGRDLFRESLNDGYMEGYFVLAEQFRTQDEPAFCGLSTLTMVLNTLAVDPKRVWKGPWRWYSESMLDCCRSLDEIKTNGIEFDQFACLGRCNSLNMLAKRPNQRHLYPTKQTKLPIIEKQNEEKKTVEIDETYETHPSPMMRNPSKRKYFTLDEFRDDVIISCLSSNDPVVIVSYSRKGLKQTGDGHFSPIAAYHKGKDMVLVMDVARFKYPPHWVNIKILYNAMCRVDKSCNKTRGWIVASSAIDKPYFFTFNTNEINTHNVLDINENICCCSTRFMQELDDKATATANVACKCSNHEPLTAIKVIKCLLSCLPLPLDKYIANQTEKFGIILEKSHEIIKTKLMNGIRDTGIYALVTDIFNDDSNKTLIMKFANCLNNKIEIITLMMLVIGNNAWKKISNHKVSNDLIQLTTVDKDKYPELSHEIMALKYQIKHLRQFLLSTFGGTIEKDVSKNCCKD